MTTFTPGQIQTAKKLVRWLVKDHKYELDAARLEVGRLLVRHPHQKIKAALSHSGCTTPRKLKEILLGREGFKGDRLELF